MPLIFIIAGIILIFLKKWELSGIMLVLIAADFLILFLITKPKKMASKEIINKNETSDEDAKNSLVAISEAIEHVAKQLAELENENVQTDADTLIQIADKLFLTKTVIELNRVIESTKDKLTTGVQTSSKQELDTVLSSIQLNNVLNPEQLTQLAQKIRGFANSLPDGMGDAKSKLQGIAQALDTKATEINEDEADAGGP